MKRLLSTVAAITLAAGTMVTAALPSGAAASQATITGTLLAGSNPVAGVKVLLLTKTGQAVVSTTGSDGAFSLSIRATRVASATLQLVSDTDRYIGPVTLATDTISEKRGAAHMQFSGAVPSNGRIALGTVSFKTASDSHPIGGVASKAKCTPKAAGTCWYYQTPAAFYNPKNDVDRSLPSAAKLYGLTKKSAPKLTNTELNGLTGKPNASVKLAGRNALQGGGGGGPSMDANTEAGSDQDSDGVPNVLDVDDNGNASLDSVDPKSATSISANLNPVTSMHLQYGSTSYRNAGFGGAFSGAEVANVEMNPSYTNADASSLIGSRGAGTSIAYDQSQLLTAVGASASDAINWARVDCGDVTYCAAGGTASFVQIGYAQGSNGDDSHCSGQAANCYDAIYGNQQLNWSDFLGYRWQPGSGSFMTGSCPAETHTGGRDDGYIPQSWVTAHPGVPANALSLLCRNDGSLRETWYAGFYNNASSAAGVSTFLPGDVYEVQVAVNSDGSVRSVPISLSPYYATVPGLVSVGNSTAPSVNTLSASTSKAQVNSDGLLTISFYRPQRLALPGETGLNGFMDQGGLHYGVSIALPNRYQPNFCGGYYSNLSSNLTNTQTTPLNESSGYKGSWSLADNQTADSVPAQSSENLYTFTVDLKSCLNHDAGIWGGPNWSSTLGSTIEISLGGMGAELATYQYNQAMSIFYVDVAN